MGIFWLMQKLLPLHLQNPLARFSNRAQDYARYRPSYPPETITTLLRDLGDPKTLTVADIGAGTGIAARLLGDRHVTVTAVEPNEAMREAAIPHPNVKFHAASAEETQLPDHHFDLITCCQAFHWFNTPLALAEFQRILKPDGRLGLLWNKRSTEDPFTGQYEDIIRHASDRQVKVLTEFQAAERVAYAPQFKNYRLYEFKWKRPMSYEALIGLTLSASYLPKSGTAYDAMRRALDNLFDQFSTVGERGDRQIQMAYHTDLHLAESTLTEG